MITHKGTKTIKTERLTLRKIRVSDYKDMLALKSNEKVAKYVSWSIDTSPKNAKKLCRKWRNKSIKKSYYLWAIEFENKFIGNIGVSKQYDNTAIIGWQINSPYWNMGIMTEAAIAVYDYLFNKVGFEYIEAAHIAENIGSGRVMQKVGMKEIPYADTIYCKYGRNQTYNGKKLVFYKLSRSEYNGTEKY